MCNDYRLLIDIASIAEDFDGLKIKIKMPEGTPNVPTIIVSSSPWNCHGS